MPSRTDKHRGSRTHGRGYKSGRGAGLRGGRGKAGQNKHNVMRARKENPNFFGRHGFTRPPKTRTVKVVVNLTYLEEGLIPLTAAGHAEEVDGMIVCDLGGAGITKLLGAGRVRRPWKVIVAEASLQAVQRVADAGGSVEISG